MASDSPYQRLSAAASLEGDDAAIRVRATYEPGAGPGAKVSPPTYPLDGRGTPYLFETRRTTDRTREVVLLDSRQSQANRCEEALQDAIDDGLGIPHLVLDVQTHDRTIRLTSLTVPHRSRDAYLPPGTVRSSDTARAPRKEPRSSSGATLRAYAKNFRASSGRWRLMR